MTADDLWNEYRTKCCPPELGESAESLYWQRVAFMAGVTATIGNILMRPACLEELRASTLTWMKNWDEE